MKIKIGTRGSKLALWQAEHVAGLIDNDQTEVKIIKTKGDKIKNVSFDKIEGKGFFTKEIEEALLKGKIDLAVHSLKDLPTEDHPDLKIAAILKRENPADLLIFNPKNSDSTGLLPIKEKSKIGTSSMRRFAQLKNIDPSLEIVPLRGNVNTRLKKLKQGLVDGIILAYAGVTRLKLNLNGFDKHLLPYDFFLPAPGQGALALQIRKSDKILSDKIKSLNDEETEKQVKAERFFLSSFGGGCHIPLGAFSFFSKQKLVLMGLVAAPDGSKIIKGKILGDDPRKIGKGLASILKKKGADKLL